LGDTMVDQTSFSFLVIIVVAKKCCCNANNEWSNEQTKAMSSYVDLVGLKVFRSVELSRT
jgi:hypothetical protein